jgi:glycerol-3-phosphate cytidylyltransferase-like family protein
MSFVLSTLHIFGYGETQVIGQYGETPVNKKTESSQLTSVQAVVDDVLAHKPADVTLQTTEYHAVNIFNNMFADFQPKEGKGFRVPFDQLNKALIDSLVAEVLAIN